MVLIATRKQIAIKCVHFRGYCARARVLPSLRYREFEKQMELSEGIVQQTAKRKPQTVRRASLQHLRNTLKIRGRKGCLTHLAKETNVN